jgi:MiaB/RimO family radical SAM methylthiotransferase
LKTRLEFEGFTTFTQGCKINQYETHALREAWLAQGCREAADPAQARVVLINSCAVTDRAVQDLRKAVRRFNKLNPEAGIVVTGCAARTFGDQIRDLPGIAAIVPQEDKAALARARPEVPSIPPLGRISPEGDGSRIFELSISSFFRARPVLKVQDGCSQRCTYCIVPHTRGGTRSRDPEAILAEARELIRAGFCELVVSGINLAQYRAPGKGPKGFWDLVLWLDRQLCRDPGSGFRLRLSSLDPVLLSERGLNVLAGSRSVCPHLHVSMQSASPGILRAMGRRPSSPETAGRFFHQVQSFWPVFGLGMDFLLGFPGESREDFELTRDICSTLDLTHAHVFTYSSRPGTPAASFQGQVGEGVKKERSRELRSLVRDRQRLFWHRLLEQDALEVVLEGVDPPVGMSQYYTFCRLTERPRHAAPGGLVRVRPVEVLEDGLLVEPLSHSWE